MKKTVTVNLGGSVVTLEEDAYSILSGYMSRLERHFANDPGKQEIIDDIEHRMAELFRENGKDEKFVNTSQDVNRVIKTMGEPGEIGDAEPNSTNKTNTHYTMPGYKRLYRDSDNRILGGVCSGLGAYWNVDPILLRILFIFLFFGIGTGFLLYLILWIAIPKAVTLTEKMEMRGEPITAENIGKNYTSTQK